MPRNPESNREIGAAMRTLRRRRRLSDSEVAERMGYGRNGKHYVNRWERGDRGITAERLRSYLRAIGANFAELDRELNPEPSGGNRRLREIARELQVLADSSRS